tara:strand:+ start:110 stop:439 length:330 start_codon:yes stop_codon:yes gene_type:complete
MKAEDIIQKKVDAYFKTEVDQLAKEINDLIMAKRQKFQGYTMNESETYTKREVLQMWNSVASVKQYGSPETCRMESFIKSMITHRVESSGKEKIAKKLLSKIEQFFDEK